MIRYLNPFTYSVLSWNLTETKENVTKIDMSRQGNEYKRQKRGNNQILQSEQRQKGQQNWVDPIKTRAR